MQNTASIILPIILFFAFLALLKAAFIVGAKKLKNEALSSFSQYQKRKELFSPAERSFLGVLEQALDNEYRIFGKVRLGDIIKPKRGLSNSLFYTALNKINKKHVDFVVCRKNDCEVIGAIELDDKSHKREDRRKRDSLVDNALQEAGVPIAHFSARMSYPVNEVKDILNEYFSLWMHEETKLRNNEFRFECMPDETSAPTEGWTLGERSSLEKAQEDVRELCPDCGTSMRVRKVSKGPHQGKFFFVCEDYPKCKTVKRVIDQVG